MDGTLYRQVYRRYWWMPALRGIVAVLFGIGAILWPHLTLFVLVLLFGAYALVDGIIAVFVALQERNTLGRWWVLLLEGIAGIIFGILTFLWLAITALVLLLLIAGWAVITGIFEIAAAFSGSLPIAQEWALGLAGVLSILLGILLFLAPGAGLLTLVVFIGAYAILFGILLIIRAFQLRRAAI